MRKWSIVLLVSLALACNFPGLPANWPLAARETPTSESSSPGATDTPTSMPGDVQNTPAPFDTPTDEQGQPSLTPTPTATATMQATPSSTPQPTNTPAPAQPAAPLAFQDPAWELVSWNKIPDTNDWQGTIRIYVTGGTAPYRSQLEDNEIVNGLDVPARWRLCAAMPATIRVWSDDGQKIQTSIWVSEVGCPSN